MMRVVQGVAWVVLPDNTFRTATPGECAARIAELEAALASMIYIFDPAALRRPPESEHVRKRLENARAVLANQKTETI